MKPKAILIEAPELKVQRNFDATPYANMGVWDVARVLDGETSRKKLNPSVIAKLLDRIVSGLTHTVLAVAGRPNASRITNLLTRSINRILERIPEFEPTNESLGNLSRLAQLLPEPQLGLPGPCPFSVDERMILADYTKYAALVADAYDARPVRDPAARASYEALRKHFLRMFKQLLSRVSIEFVNEAEPYKDAADMTRRVKAEGVMYVSTLFSENLASGWTPRENWMFRAVHDYIVHIGGGHDFSLRGELGTFNRHAKVAPVAARPALFSEIVGQVAYAITRKRFPSPQKACILYGFDYVNVGRIDPEEYKRNWSENTS